MGNKTIQLFRILKKKMNGNLVWRTGGHMISGLSAQE